MTEMLFSSSRDRLVLLRLQKGFTVYKSSIVNTSKFLYSESVTAMQDLTYLRLIVAILGNG
jgi:hypothetical protein